MSIATMAFLVFIGLAIATVIIMTINYDEYWEKLERLYNEKLKLRS